MGKFKSITLAGTLSLMAAAAWADGHAKSWTLDPALSNVSFGSIKNDYVGESHSFGDISGGVTGNGQVEISLGLGSVQTNIDIRNERMIEHVFKNAPDAKITAEIDMSELDALAIGEATTIETFGTVALLGTDNELDAKLFVMRLSETQVMVASEGMVMLSTEDAGINAGIDVLQELAGLDSITRVSPVSLRLFFTSGS
ncbi:MAG: YceI family protein [Litoreibacter sp.]|nr:YceI family protein [Litoreibacter sp.]MCY4336916.1 YceI family protein [Litoreibacter sp.]